MEINKILDIDYLKNNNTRIYYFGLGFIQVVLNKEERVHFYNTHLAAINDEIHNHRYNFTSTILKGCLMEKRYILTTGDTHVLMNESCNADNKPSNQIKIGVGIKETDEFFRTGQYDIFFNDFHSVGYQVNTITHLKRSDIITDYAQVIYEKGKEITCPFSHKIPESELWEIINDTIIN